MQPYFLPYIGYFQLINAVDLFVVYDNIKYTKKGWINRNRLLSNGKDTWFTLPLMKASDSSLIADRNLAAEFDRKKLLRQIEGAYSNTPYYHHTFPLLERIVNYEADNLFDYIYHSLVAMCQHLGITTPLRISSGIDIDHDLKGKTKVIAICNTLGANEYINPIGGLDLYDQMEFQHSGIKLQFLHPQPCEYQQSHTQFVPWLSILDVLMFNPLGDVRERFLKHYELV